MLLLAEITGCRQNGISMSSLVEKLKRKKIVWLWSRLCLHDLYAVTSNRVLSMLLEELGYVLTIIFYQFCEQIFNSLFLVNFSPKDPASFKNYTQIGPLE